MMSTQFLQVIIYIILFEVQLNCRNVLYDILCCQLIVYMKKAASNNNNLSFILVCCAAL